VNAKFILGEGSRSLIDIGYPKNDDNGYLQDTAPNDRVQWLSFHDWTSFGPFERGFDFFGDGSFYIIDATGHLPGHINIIFRTDASGKWAYLAADSAHDYRLITGEKQFGHFPDGKGNICCVHQDEAAAKDNIRRIQSLPENVTVLIAHDPQWREREKML
jgi:glyoxylase-like metal-dependent hydrolase (beta-lactamase superfamily II)